MLDDKQRNMEKTKGYMKKELNSANEKRNNFADFLKVCLTVSESSRS